MRLHVTRYSRPMNMRQIPQYFIGLLGTAAVLTLQSVGFAQGTAPSSDYTNSFDIDTSTKSWIYWYGLGYNNTAMTWDSTMDAKNDPNSGSLMVSLPFSTTGDQGVWFGTWHNGYGYDGT